MKESNGGKTPLEILETFHQWDASGTERISSRHLARHGGENLQCITEIRNPEWVENLLAFTGISGLVFRIGEERQRRADEFYVNPHPKIHSVVISMNFEVFIACVIILNCALIGWKASMSEGDNEQLFGFFEHFFTAFFMVEWLLRIFAFGWTWVFEAANMAETLLVFGTGTHELFAELVGLDVWWFHMLTVLRAFRLVHLVHAIRLNPRYKELWVLFHGLVMSTRPLLWTLVIGSTVLYVFAVAATELIGRSDSFTEDEYIQELFGNGLRSMCTMFQLITFDNSFAEVIRPVTAIDPWFVVFFVLFIAIGGFVLLNLIVAIIFQNAQRIRVEDEDARANQILEEKKRDLNDLADLFLEIDVDGSGEISREEFFSALGNRKVTQILDVLEMKVSELQETWEVLDDGDGRLNIKEFTDGIRRMKGKAKAKDIFHVIKKLQITRQKHNELKRQAARYTQTLHALESDTAKISDDMDMVVTLFQECYHRLSAYIDKMDRDDLTQ